MSGYATKVGDRVRTVDRGWTGHVRLGTVETITGTARPNLTIKWDDGAKDVVRGNAARHVPLAWPDDPARVAAQRVVRRLEDLAHRIQYGDGRQKLLQRLTANPELGAALTEAAKTLVAATKDDNAKDSE